MSNPIGIDGVQLREKCTEGTIITYCGDGDQSLEFQLHLLGLLLDIPMNEPHSISHLIEMITKKHLRMHQHSHNGGALRLHEQLSVSKEMQINDHLLIELTQSRQLKKIPTLILTAHAPCGMAKLAHCSIADTIWHIITCARAIETKIGWDHNRILILFHVDFGTKKRTFFVKKKKKALIYG